MRSLYALLLFFVLGVAQAQQPVPIEIKGAGVKVVKVDKVVIVKEDMTLVSSLPFTIHAPAGNLLYVWSYPQGVTARKKGEVLEITTAPKGSVTISVEMISVDFDAKKVVTKYGEVTFTVGDAPIPPEPKPPEPKPPDVAPIPVDGFRVLIIHESADKIPPAQRAIVTAQVIRQYVNAKCVKGPDGVTAEARFWDKDTIVSGESKLWQDAMNRPRSSIPWIIISTGKAGFEGPLPATVADTLALLKKYGGE